MDSITLLYYLLKQPVDSSTIQYVASAVNSIVHCSAVPITAEISHTLPLLDNNFVPTVDEFISHVVASANVGASTLVSTLVYTSRVKARMQSASRGLCTTPHRIFLACLIVCAKYLNDRSPRNADWALHSAMSSSRGNFSFSLTEINLMERQLLRTLDWNMGITMKDLCNQLETFHAQVLHHLGNLNQPL